jgi:hypothetical protein
MARITVRPTWVGLLDAAGDRRPGVITSEGVPARFEHPPRGRQRDRAENPSVLGS